MHVVFVNFISYLANSCHRRTERQQ